MTRANIAVIGAGIMGSMAAFVLQQAGHSTTVFEQKKAGDFSNCSHAAAGRLAPFSELEHAEHLIAELGEASLPIWHNIAPNLIQKCGTLAVAHRENSTEITRVLAAIQNYTKKPVVQHLKGGGVKEIEADIAFAEGLYLPSECLIEPAQILQHLHNQLNIRFGQPAPQNLEGDFDWVIDCRGLEAGEGLRGVRGEAYVAHAPDVEIKTHITLLHPRYPIYIVPRGNSQFYIGATLIESQDTSPMSVRSSLELLSAAYSVHKGFGEARIVETIVQCRPAYADNLPCIKKHGKTIAVNGLYRHGYMVSPILAELTKALVEQKSIDPNYQKIVEA